MLSELKILVIDDDEDDFFITSQYLKEITAFTVVPEWSYNIQDAQERLASNRYDIYLLDYRLGARTGLDLLKDAISQGCEKPIILLTGKGNSKIDLQAVESGAYDYLIKSELTSEKLERCFRYAWERYRSFRVINENQKKYRLIFNNALNVIFTCDESMHFTDCNKAVEFFLEIRPEALYQTSFLEIVSEEDRPKVERALKLRRSIRNQSIRFIAANGEIKHGNLSLDFFEMEDRAPHWQGIVYDETLRNQAEQAKIQTEKLETTSRLIRTLAHEIRNPLTNIGLSLDGLLEEGVSEEHSFYLDIVRRSSARINDIISELLNSSKAIELNMENTDLKQLLEDTLSTAQDSIRLKNVHTEISLHPEPIIRPIDKEKFKIALLNLIFNAIEATDKEYNLLTVELSHSPENTMICIGDNGSGISEENLNKLFEPYFTTKKSGMGLGLVATLNIIKTHQARIEVQSKVGTGTNFRIIFDN